MLGRWEKWSRVILSVRRKYLKKKEIEREEKTATETVLSDKKWSHDA